MLLQQSEIPSGFYSRILWSLPQSSSSNSSEENLVIRNFESFFTSLVIKSLNENYLILTFMKEKIEYQKEPLI